jgi:hypothetical protein
MLIAGVAEDKNIRVVTHKTLSTFQNGGDTGGGTSAGGSKDPLQGGTVSVRSGITPVVSMPTG